MFARVAEVFVSMAWKFMRRDGWPRLESNITSVGQHACRHVVFRSTTVLCNCSVQVCGANVQISTVACLIEP